LLASQWYALLYWTLQIQKVDYPSTELGSSIIRNCIDGFPQLEVSILHGFSDVQQYVVDVIRAQKVSTVLL
jgi:hypothetical protein